MDLEDQMKEVNYITEFGLLEEAIIIVMKKGYIWMINGNLVRRNFNYG